jgi:hypothetical protein
MIGMIFSFEMGRGRERMNADRIRNVRASFHIWWWDHACDHLIIHDKFQALGAVDIALWCQPRRARNASTPHITIPRPLLKNGNKII